MNLGSAGIAATGLFMTAFGIKTLNGQSFLSKRGQAWVNQHRVGALMTAVATTVAIRYAYNSMSEHIFTDLGNAFPKDARKPAERFGKAARRLVNNAEDIGSASGWYKHFSQAGNLAQILFSNIPKARRNARKVRNAK